MRRQRKFDKSILLLAIIIIAVIGTVLFLVLRFRSDELSETLKDGKPIATAFLVSKGDSLLFTEIFFYDPGTSKAAILDVPGETGSIIESIKRIDRIDVLYKKGKPQAFLRKVESLIGNPVRYYIELDLADIERLTDLLEGVEMFIANPIEIKQEDRLILLPSGSIVLDGSKTSLFLTFEDAAGDSDLDRTGRNQKYIQALLERIGKMRIYLENEDVFRYFQGYVKTNMEKKSLLSFMKEMQKLDVERIVFQRVLGIMREVDSQKLLFPHYDGKLLKETIKQTIETLASTEAGSGDELVISLEILNGTKVTGLASRSAQVFQSFGFDIGYLGNTENSDVEKTIVYSTSPDLSKAQKAADIIRCRLVSLMPEQGIPKGQQSAADTTAARADVIIVLGSDFDGRYCKD
ncbi:MAG: LytR family transcriptional regulator [Spirochaetales bacterium]|nr:MAG: LytR family transcriptional regulator [Spirochaetales bacterium]